MSWADPLGCLALGAMIPIAIALLGALGVGVGVALAMRGRVGDRE